MGAEFSPLQLIATFPGFPYIPFGRDSPSMNRDLRDVGMARQARQSLSIMEKMVVVTAFFEFRPIIVSARSRARGLNFPVGTFFLPTLNLELS